jgi:hypothetical protein
VLSEGSSTSNNSILIGDSSVSPSSEVISIKSLGSLIRIYNVATLAAPTPAPTPTPPTPYISRLVDSPSLEGYAKFLRIL